MLELLSNFWLILGLGILMAVGVLGMWDYVRYFFRIIHVKELVEQPSSSLLPEKQYW